MPMSRRLVALAAACVIGLCACGTAQAEPAAKSSKSNISEKTKRGGQGQSARPITDRNNGLNTGSRADCEF
jgi:hypothetical protein